MKHEQYMTDADRKELKAIEAAAGDVRKRRIRLMNRLRQRAYQDKKQISA